MDNAQDETWELTEEGCYVSLTRDHLDAVQTMNRVRSPEAGAIVLFAGKPNEASRHTHTQARTCLTRTHVTLATGTTRDSFAGKPVKELTYTAYNKLALRTMLSICVDLRAKHGLKGVAMTHRLGTVPIAEDHPLQPQSPYSASKIGGDMMALSFHHAFDLPVAVVRRPLFSPTRARRTSGVSRGTGRW